ncbi:MAG: pilin [Candidatus Komeilibacteria bacterium]|nr:pilin [Candidatus Komeilibacteria bacterium]
MNKYLLHLIIFTLLISPWLTLADNPMQELVDVAAVEAGFSPAVSPYQTAGLIIQYILGFVGLIFLVLIVASGLQWMTAGGNEDAITKARKRMINASIGLAIILMAYSITWWISQTAFNALNEQ